jgi:hypothetical protein
MSYRRLIGYDIATAELGWPIGMPLCRSIAGRKGLWEVRTNLTDGKIARVFFCVNWRPKQYQPLAPQTVPVGEIEGTLALVVPFDLSLFGSRPGWRFGTV